MPLEGFVPHSREDADRYVRNGAWMNVTLADVLDRAASSFPDKEALVDGPGRFTYAGLQDTTELLADAMLRLGIRPGDCVLLQLPNWNEFVISFYALHRIGAPAVLLLPRHRQTEINYFCSLTKATAWIVPARHRNTDYVPVIRDVMDANPSLKHVITVRAKDDTRFARLEKLIADAASDRGRVTACGIAPPPRKPPADDVAFVIPTGGTTGLPKAVPRTHNDAICEARYKASARQQSGEDVCMISVPLEHNLGLAALNGTVFNAGKIVMVDSTRADDLCATIQRERVTRAPLVPALLSRLASFDGLGRYDLSSLKAFYVGGARTPPEVITAVHENIGRVYMGAFGMSEGAGCTTGLEDADDVLMTSIGRPCCPHDEYKVVDGTGETLPRNTEGELMVKGPCVFGGYLNYPEENARAFTKDGFFRTGDLARIDDAGNIRITGRIKDVIIRGGENISPVEIEALIRAHPGVEDVAVVGMPDAELGERACAYVKPRPGARPTIDDITAFLRERGASVLQLPERVELVEDIPLTEIGKADKKALREDIKKRLASVPGAPGSPTRE